VGDLVISEDESKVSVDGDRLLVSCGDQSQPLPLKDVDKIVITANIDVSTRALGALKEKGVDVIVINLSRGKRSFVLESDGRLGTALKAAQYAWFNTDRRAVLSKSILLTRWHYIDAVIRKWPDEWRRSAFVFREQLHAAIAALNGDSFDAQAILGIEGSVQRQWFKLIGERVASKWQFTHRNRRPPKDPFNAVLSLAYGMAFGEASRMIRQRGLDPYVGCWHRLCYGRESLTCDLLEVARPAVDMFVVQLMMMPDFHKEWFLYREDACEMISEAKGEFFRSWSREKEAIQALYGVSLNSIVNWLKENPAPNWPDYGV